MIYGPGERCPNCGADVEGVTSKHDTAFMRQLQADLDAAAVSYHNRTATIFDLIDASNRLVAEAGHPS